MLNERRKNTLNNEAYRGSIFQPIPRAPDPSYHVLPFYHSSYLLGHPLCLFKNASSVLVVIIVH